MRYPKTTHDEFEDELGQDIVVKWFIEMRYWRYQ